MTVLRWCDAVVYSECRRFLLRLPFHAQKKTLRGNWKVMFTHIWLSQPVQLWETARGFFVQQHCMSSPSTKISLTIWQCNALYSILHLIFLISNLDYFWPRFHWHFLQVTFTFSIPYLDFARTGTTEGASGNGGPDFQTLRYPWTKDTYHQFSRQSDVFMMRNVNELKTTILWNEVDFEILASDGCLACDARL